MSRSQHQQMRDAINDVELALNAMEIDSVARLFEGAHDSVMVKFPLGAVRQLARCYPALNRIINDRAFEKPRAPSPADHSAFEKEGAELTALPPPVAWQPMEIAPKDGSRFLAKMHDGREPPDPYHEIIEWNSHGQGKGSWMTANGCEFDEDAEARGYCRPLGWLPLPSLTASVEPAQTEYFPVDGWSPPSTHTGTLAAPVAITKKGEQ